MRFVETPVFTAALRRHLDDETYRALQLALVLRPEQGPILQGDLRPTQLKVLARLVREEFT
jgi:hypothetical protein